MLNEDEKSKIVMLKDLSNFPNRVIAGMINRNEKVIRNFLKDRENYGKNHPGKKPTIKKHQISLLRRAACNSSNSSKSLRDEFNLDISVRRTQQLLSSCEYLKNEKRVNKPYLSPKNIEVRKKFAIDHISWKKEWLKVIFSDEKKFNLDGPDGWSHYWHDLRTEKRIFSKRQSGGGSVMIWGAIGYLKKVDLIFIEHTMNSEHYQQMVGPLFPAYGYELAGLGWMFQQDNAPIHCSRSTLAYFQERNIKLFEPWPSKSPDMNIIENLWSILAREVYKNGRQYASKAELKASIVEAWRNISQVAVQNLFHSMQRRMIALYDAKGKWTKY